MKKLTSEYSKMKNICKSMSRCICKCTCFFLHGLFKKGELKLNMKKQRKKMSKKTTKKTSKKVSKFSQTLLKPASRIKLLRVYSSQK